MADPPILTREDLGLREPTRRPDIIAPRLRLGIVAHHNGPLLRLDPGWSDDRLRRRERAIVVAIQRYHMDTLGWSDEAYSWFIGQSGDLYEGRGLRWDQFANGDDQVGPDDGPDRVWYSCMFLIGWDPATGREEEPTQAALETFRWLIGHVREEGAGDRVLPHNDFKVKVCPGRTVSDECDRLDGRQIGDPPMTFPDQLEQWRTEYNRADPDDDVQVVRWVQQFLIDTEHLGGIFAVVDGKKGEATDAAWTAWEMAARGDTEGNPHAGRRSWRLMFDRILWPGGRPDPGPDVDDAIADLAIAADAIHAAQRTLLGD